MLALTCENSVDEHRDTLATRKADTANHGLGMESIRAIVSKYRGEMQYVFKDHCFHIELTVLKTKVNRKSTNSFLYST